MSILTIQLIHAQHGTLKIDDGDPIGLNDLKQTLKRAKGLDGMVREVSINLGYIKRARTWISDAFTLYGGPDVDITVNVYEQDPNLHRNILYATGKINFNTADLGEDTFNLTTEQAGFQRKVENGLDLPVDVETLLSIDGVVLDPIAVIAALPLHSKKIQRTLSVRMPADQGPYTYTIPGSGYANVNFEEIEVEELQEKKDTGYGVSVGVPPAPMFVAKEAGTYNAVIRVNTTVNFTNYVPNLKCLLQVNNDAPTELAIVNNGVDGADGATAFTCNEDLLLDVGDTIRLYFQNTFIGDNTFTLYVGFDITPTRMVLTALTSFRTTTAKSILLFEAGQRCAEFITNEENCFVSDLLGRTDLDYDEDGAGSLIALNNGRTLRGQNTKKIFTSLREILNVTNSLYGTGLGIETGEDGKQKVRIDHKRKFYDKTNLIIDLGSVYDVRTRLNYDRLFNQFVYGYSSKIDVKQVNAVDAFNTLRKVLMPLRNSKNSLNVATSIKADGYQIEMQRRLNGLTEDGRLDDENFIIQCIRDGMGYKSKKAEGYDLVTGIVDYASAYNLDISPARILQNWRQYLSVNAIYAADKSAKFLSGDGNYTMVSTKTGEDPLAENGTVSLEGFIPLFTPWDIYFDCKLTSTNFRTIRNNPYGYLSLTNKDNRVFRGFISEKGITHEVNNGVAKFDLIEMFTK